MKHLLENNNITVGEDTNIFGKDVKAGTKITIVSKQGEYNRNKMRIPPPEFEALMLFHALESAKKSEELKKIVKTSKSNFDSLPEIDNSDSNTENFFSACQNAMASVTFSISALESWANKSIEILGQKNGEPTDLIWKRPNKEDKKVKTNKIASNSSISIRVKLFQLIPQIFSIKPLKESSRLRKEISNLVDDRNIVMHMKLKIKISDEEKERVSYAIKLFKINSFSVPELILSYLDYVYSKSSIDKPEWIGIAQKELIKFKRQTK